MANLRYYITPGRTCRLFCVRELISTDVNVYGMINSNRNQFPLLENPKPFHTQMNLITAFKNFVWNLDSLVPRSTSYLLFTVRGMVPKSKKEKMYPMVKLI